MTTAHCTHHSSPNSSRGTVTPDCALGLLPLLCDPCTSALILLAPHSENCHSDRRSAFFADRSGGTSLLCALRAPISVASVLPLLRNFQLSTLNFQPPPPFRKAPEARHKLAQRVSAGYATTNTPAPEGRHNFFLFRTPPNASVLQSRLLKEIRGTVAPVQPDIRSDCACEFFLFLRNFQLSTLNFQPLPVFPQ